jgi:hypothetical protein
MDLSPWIARRRHLVARRPVVIAAAASAMALASLMSGCASPGPPRSPSLAIPEPVTDLAVHRVGNTVQLQFTVPSRSTDKLPLRGTAVLGTFCRQIGRGPCVTPAGTSARIPVPILDSAGHRSSVSWTDALPPEIASGTRQLLAYRVEFFSVSGHSAGPSEAAYTASGAPPSPISGLRAEGSRLGVILHWDPESPRTGETLIERESPTQVSAKASAVEPPVQVASEAKSKPNSHHAAAPHPAKATGADIWLTADPSLSTSTLLDTSVQLDTTYLYRATRRTAIQLGGRTIELRGARSAPVGFTLRPVYAPPVPNGLTAAGFLPDPGQEPASPTPTFAIDLIWQPVDASGLIVPLAGYNVYRQLIGPDGQPLGERQMQNATPLSLPAFHDATAISAQRYLYLVTAVDAHANQSAAASVLIDPSPSR